MGSRAAVSGLLMSPPIVTCTTLCGWFSRRPPGEPKWVGPATRCPPKLAPEPVGEAKVVGMRETREATADTGSGLPVLMPVARVLTKSEFVAASAGRRKMGGRLRAQGQE